VFLAPGRVSGALFGEAPTTAGPVNALACPALRDVLVEIPFRVLPTLRITSGRSLTGSPVRGCLA
jgi:hypothetical protein